MVRYSTPLILNNISWWVIHSSDKFMIEAMISASALGVFTVATKIPSLINVLINIFSQAWGISSVKEMDSSDDHSFFSKVFNGYTFLTFTVCILLVSVIMPFMRIYVGKNFQEAGQYVPLLLVSAVFSSIAAYYGQIYSALKKSVNVMVTTFAGAVINILINYVCILLFGIWGAVIGTVAAYIFMAVSRMIDTRRYLKIQINYGSFVINCILIVIQALFVSFNILAPWVSVIVFGLFIMVNRQNFTTMIHSIKKGISSKRQQH